ncbi:MAG: carbon-nitrogen hydrolase family protein [Steroidobacteraceae bacterium]|nr:carbon-nitrogen hydrolase family protein [Steroidobacteraceae bacterium]
MSEVRVAAIQMTTSADVAENLAQAGALLAQAADRGAAVAALPENFAFMGLADADKRAIAEVQGAGPIQDFLARTAERRRLMVIGGTLPLRIEGGDGRVAAACLVFDASGVCVARYDKIHLFDVDLPAAAESYRESAHVAPGRRSQVIDTPAGRLGLAVCYDIRFPELFRQLSAEGAEWFVLPSAFTAPTGEAHWETLLRARAIENLAYLVAPAQSGRHANGRLTYGDTMIVDYWGRILERQPAGPGCVVAPLDRVAQADARAHFPALRHRVL